IPTEESAAPDMITAQLEFGGITGDTVYYDPGSFESGDALVFALQADATTLDTGRYDWEMTVTYHYGMDTIVRTYYGVRDVINRSESEFGKGWHLNELDRLMIEMDGVNLITGSNQAIWFAEDSGDYTAEEGKYQAHSLVKNMDDTFTLTAPDGSRQEFDEDGL